MNFETNGQITEIYETQKISDRFQKREFVIEMKSSSATGFEFVDFIKFQSTQDKCGMLDQFKPGDMVKVSFNLRGRKWEKDGQVSYFTNLEAWRVEGMQNDSSQASGTSQDNYPVQDAPFPTQAPDEESGVDDLPF
ncbi:MAG: DUF3127 domain-containing protein [Bacteroidales bacterium]